jgi:hypothetical protein
MIEISGQYGCVLSDDAIAPMHRRLNELFAAGMRRDYGAKVTRLAIILRVSGALQDFGSEGPERLFVRRKDKYLEIDLAIPRSAWEEKPLPEVRRYLVRGLRSAFALLKERLLTVDREANVDGWESDFGACLDQFLKENGSREPPRKYESAQAREAWRQRIRRTM